ncbi:hypothetical protein BH09PLA1_BH09PLA1_04190 [soil metagenome]
MSLFLRLLAPDVAADRFGGAELVLRPVIGAIWFVLIAFALLAIAVLLYRGLHDVSSVKKYFAAGLRAVFLLLLLGLLLRPTLRFNLEGTMRRALILLLDDSASMKIADLRSDSADRLRAQIALGVIDPAKGLDQPAPPLDSAFVPIARTDLLKSVLTNARLDLLKKLAIEYDLRVFSFAQSTDEHSGPDWPGHLSGQGRSTAEGDALADVLARTRGQPLAGIVLCTDGANNSGNAAPLSAAETAGRQSAPVYVYGVGLASPKDVIVSNIFAQDVAFKDDLVPVAVRVRSSGLEGQPAKIVLKQGEERVAEEPITFSGGEQLVSVNFTPKKAGDFKLTASIDPVTDEVVKDNNSQTQPIRVVDAKIKVLLIEQSPRWEFKYIQALLLRDRRIKLKCVLMEGDPSIASYSDSPYLARVPTDKKELFEYDLIILGDVDPRNLSAGQLEAMNEFVSKLGGGMLLIAGKSYSPWAYRGTALEKLLPVELASDDRAARESSSDKPIRVELTPAGQRSMMMRLADTELDSSAIWSKLPPIYWDAAVARAKPAAEVLLVDADPTRGSRFGKRPVLAIQQYGAGQVCYVGTDNTWRWRRNVGDKLHAALWGQIVQRLSLPHLLGESKRIQLTADKRNYSLGEKVTIFARLFTESYEPLAESSVRGFYSATPQPGAARQPVALKPLPDQPGMYRAEFTAREPGEYQFALERDEKVTLPITIADAQLELGDTAMNEPQLRQIAATSGGAFFREEDLFKLPDVILRKTETVKSSIDVEVWNSPLYFITLIVVVASEWLLRKAMQLK